MRACRPGLLLCAALAACNGTTERAGMPEWSVDSVPAFDVTGTGADAPFGYVRAGTRLAADRIILGDQYAGHIHVLDSLGQPVRTIGRRGKGRGEFLDLRWIGQCTADGLFVWDYTLRTISVLDLDGNEQRRFRPDGNPHELRCSGGGIAILDLPAFYAEPAEDPPIPPARLWISDFEGREIRAAGEFGFGQNRPLGRRTRLAMSQQALFIGTAETDSIDVLGLDGVRIRSIATGGVERAPGPEHLAAGIEEMLSIATDARLRDYFRAIYRRIPMPARLPPYSDLLTDPDGVLWVVTSFPGDEATALTALSDTGEIVVKLAFRPRLEVMEIGRDHILGTYFDNGGTQHAALYRLRRRPAGLAGS